MKIYISKKEYEVLMDAIDCLMTDVTGDDDGYTSYTLKETKVLKHVQQKLEKAFG